MNLNTTNFDLSAGFDQKAASDIAESMRTNYMGIASFTVLVWDHLQTLADEVEYVWKGKKGLIIYLFFFIRYSTPLAFSINLYAYFSPLWTFEVCNQFVRYEGSATIIAIETVGLMMLLRIRALYSSQKWLVWSLATLLLLETGVNIWLMTHGESVAHTPYVHSCTMIFDPAISVPASSSAWIPLLYDSIVLGLTLYRTIPLIKNKTAGYITQRLLEDGLLYYSVICIVTIMLTVMVISSPPGVKNITAQLEQLLTVAMMSRITIGLKKAGRRATNVSKSPPPLFLLLPAAQNTVRSDDSHSDKAIQFHTSASLQKGIVVSRDPRLAFDHIESHEMHAV